MYQIKRLPEDFIVTEESSLSFADNGKYAYFVLKKTNTNTVDAISRVAQAAKVPIRFVGFAGNKDKNAVTEQKISIPNIGKNFQDYSFNNFELKYLGKGVEPLSLGSNIGNNFEITIRNLDESEIKKLESIKNKLVLMPNYFGPQRFSKNNHLAGRAIVKKDFKLAVELILESEKEKESEIKSALINSKNDYAGALRKIPLRTRKIFIHAYQSYIFNRAAKELFDSGVRENILIPIIGFGFEYEEIKNKKLMEIISRIIKEENLNPRDFIINQMPEISSEGTSRSFLAEIENFEKSDFEDDELNEGKKKCRIKFFLKKGSYATVAVDFLFS